jgi:hypothetical protein
LALYLDGAAFAGPPLCASDVPQKPCVLDYHDFSGERLLGGVASNRNWMADEASEWHCDSEGEMLTRMAWQAKTWQHIGAFLPVFKRGSGVLRSLV